MQQEQDDSRGQYRDIGRGYLQCNVCETSEQGNQDSDNETDPRNEQTKQSGKKKKNKLENQDQIKMFEDALESYFTKKIDIEVKFYPDEWINKWKNLLSKKNIK